MSAKNTSETYGWVAKTLHWLMFALIACAIIMGLTMTDMENSPDKFRLYGLHKSFGVLVLMLVVARLSWKLANIAPLLPDTLSPIQKKLAHAGHAGLYALMFALPITGWMMSSAAGFPVSFFGWFTLPNLVGPDKEFGKLMNETHGLLANGLMVLVGLHGLAALLHHVYYRDNVLRRMLPWR